MSSPSKKHDEDDPPDHTRKAANTDPNLSSRKKTKQCSASTASSSHQNPNSTNLGGLIVWHDEEPVTTSNADIQRYSSVFSGLPISSSEKDGPSSTPVQDNKTSVGCGGCSDGPVTTHREPPRTSGLPVGSAFDELAYIFTGEQSANMTQNVNAGRPPLPVSAAQFWLNPNTTLYSPANILPRVPPAYNHVPEIELGTPQIVPQVRFPLVMEVQIPPLPQNDPQLLPAVVFPQFPSGLNGDPVWQFDIYWVPPGPQLLRVSFPSLLPEHIAPRLLPILSLPPDNTFLLPLGNYNPHQLLIEATRVPHQYLSPGAADQFEFNVPHQLSPPAGYLLVF